jgi:glycosyltransferase 2 family protein
VARFGVAGVVLGVLVWRLGVGPFLRAFDRITVSSLIAALLVTGVTTLCAAWRWTWVAGRLDLGLDVRAAVAAYYRSQLLNQVLPGGVLGDVDRAVWHGDRQAALGRAARAVVWERTLGQLGLVSLTLLAVLGLPSALPGDMVWLPLAGLGVLAAVALLVPRLAGRVPRIVGEDLRRLTEGGPWLPLVLSVAAAAGHLLVLLVALRATEVDVPLVRAVPLLLVVLVASSLPTNIAGWGPREGVAAWVFAAAGLGAAEGVTVAAVYGILSLAAAAPGALVLTLDVLPRRIGVDSR